MMPVLVDALEMQALSLRPEKKWMHFHLSYRFEASAFVCTCSGTQAYEIEIKIVP